MPSLDQRVETAPEAPVAGRPPVDNLPAPITSFVGRIGDTRQVLRLIETGRLVTITGTPGTGKTRLAVEAARQLTSRYRDGVWYANLAACTDIGPSEELIASVLGVAALNAGPAAFSAGPDARSTAEAITDYVARKDSLLVLDDVEHVASGLAPVIESMLRAAPQLNVLVTSRIPLGVAG